MLRLNKSGAGYFRRDGSAVRRRCLRCDGLRGWHSENADWWVQIRTAKTAIESTSGEGYIDTGVKIIIGVVIGGVILAGLYALFNTTIIPTLTTKIGEMFNYAG